MQVARINEAREAEEGRRGERRNERGKEGSSLKDGWGGGEQLRYVV
jgi:hypothetical protein